MGDLLKAVCKCGYESELLSVGAGFSSWETGRTFTVAYCDHCGHVQSVDDGEKLPKCESCDQQLVYYVVDSAELSPPHGPAENAEAQLWHCPACKTNNLRFETAGLWD